MDPVDPSKTKYNDEYQMDGLYAKVWFGLSVKYITYSAIYGCLFICTSQTCVVVNL